jgi:hypothetical protein
MNYFYDRVCLVKAIIPKSYYLINNNPDKNTQFANNEFILIENGSNTVNILIPKGNYTIESFRLTIISLLNTNSPNGYTYDITYPTVLEPETGFFTYKLLTAGNARLLFNVDSNGNILNQLFGFPGLPNNAPYYQTDPFSIGNDLLSNVYVNFYGNETLYLKSHIVDDHTNNTFTPILANISIDPTKEVIVYQCPEIEGHSRSMNSSNNNIFTFTLTDVWGNTLDLNGRDFTFEILIYKRNNIDHLLYIENHKFENDNKTVIKTNNTQDDNTKNSDKDDSKNDKTDDKNIVN